MNKKRKTTMIILWSVSGALLAAGVVMVALGISPLFAYFNGVVEGMGTGDVPDFPGLAEFAVAFAGAALLVVGLILLIVTFDVSNRYRKREEAAADNERVRRVIEDAVAAGQSSAQVTIVGDNFGYCPRCGKPVDNPSYKICPYCGMKLVSTPELLEDEPEAGTLPVNAIACPYCGMIVENGEEECPMCGHRLKDE